MNNITHQTAARELALIKIIKSKEKELQNAPEGALRALRKGKNVQYYVINAETGPNGRYLKVSEKADAGALAQKEYDSKVLKAAKKEKKLLEALNRFYEKQAYAETQFQKMPGLKQALISPIELPDDEYAARWLQESYTGLEFREGTPFFFSDNDEPMRSKSEVIIANMLKKYGVPYRYEYPITLDGRTVHPDFTILQVRCRKVLYWEHLGMLDNQDYLNQCVRKLSRYEMNGIFPGDRLILTWETVQQPLNMKLIEKNIEMFCI